MDTTQTISDSTVYDPQRPWLRDAEDDPSKANWGQVYFNPHGETRKPVFLRGQVLLWIMRYVVICVAFTLATGKLTHFLPLVPTPKLGDFEGAPVLGFSMLFGALFVFSVMSIISHIRRLHDAKRSPLWSLIVPIPLVLGMLFATLALLGGNAALQKAAAKDKAPSVAENVERVEEAPPAEQQDAEASENAEASATDGEAKAKPQRRRGPPPAPPTRDGVIKGAMSAGLNSWLIFGFLVMLFSTMFVARAQPKTEKLVSR